MFQSLVFGFKSACEHILDRLGIEYHELKTGEECVATLVRDHNFTMGMLQTMPQLLFVVDIAYNQVIYANHQLTKFLGYKSLEIEGQSVEELLSLIHPEDYPRCEKIFHELLEPAADQVFEITARLKSKEGKWKWFRATNVVFKRDKNNKPVQVLCIAEDITDHKQMERSLVEAKERAEANARARQHILSVMSHEIRTPLNAIVGMVNLLQTDLQPSETNQYLNVLKFSSDHLVAIINNILDFNKLESEKIILEEKSFDLKGFLNTIYASHRYQATQKHIDFKFEVDPSVPDYIVSDPLRLIQVLDNLLANAIKFTHEGYVTFRCKSSEISKNRVTLYFEIEDTGIGIDEEQHEKIFEDFTQADISTSRIYGGSGLGLTIARRLINLFGGEISIKSKAGKGSCFYFDLEVPLAEQPIDNFEPFASDQHYEDQLNHLKILLVEDNEYNRLVTEKFLEIRDLHPKIARDGKEAVIMAGQEQFDVILMDLKMPVINGYEAVRLIRSTANPNSDTPVIALTASALFEDTVKLKDQGFTCHLSKPFKPHELYAVLARCSDLKNISEWAPSPSGNGKNIDTEKRKSGTLNLINARQNAMGDEIFYTRYLKALIKSIDYFKENFFDSITSGDESTEAFCRHNIYPILDLLGEINLKKKIEHFGTDGREQDLMVKKEVTERISYLSSALEAEIERRLKDEI